MLRLGKRGVGLGMRVGSRWDGGGWVYVMEFMIWVGSLKWDFCTLNNVSMLAVLDIGGGTEKL